MLSEQIFEQNKAASVFQKIGPNLLTFSMIREYMVKFLKQHCPVKDKKYVLFF